LGLHCSQIRCGRENGNSGSFRDIEPTDEKGQRFVVFSECCHGDSSGQGNAGWRYPTRLGFIQQKHYAISVQELSEKLHAPVGITQLQNLFIGLPLIDTCSPLNQKTDINGQAYCAYPSTQGLYFITAFTPYFIKSYFASQGNTIPITAELRATELRHQEKPDDFVSVSYENWLPTTAPVANPANPNAIAPIAINKLPNYIYIQSQNAQDSAQIKMWLKNSRFDAIPSFPFNVTSEYTRMSLK